MNSKFVRVITIHKQNISDHFLKPFQYQLLVIIEARQFELHL